MPEKVLRFQRLPSDAAQQQASRCDLKNWGAESPFEIWDISFDDAKNIHKTCLHDVTSFTERQRRWASKTFSSVFISTWMVCLIFQEHASRFWASYAPASLGFELWRPTRAGNVFSEIFLFLQFPRQWDGQSNSLEQAKSVYIFSSTLLRVVPSACTVSIWSF